MSGCSSCCWAALAHRLTVAAAMYCGSSPSRPMLWRSVAEQVSGLIVHIVVAGAVVPPWFLWDAAAVAEQIRTPTVSDWTRDAHLEKVAGRKQVKDALLAVSGHSAEADTEFGRTSGIPTVEHPWKHAARVSPESRTGLNMTSDGVLTVKCCRCHATHDPQAIDWDGFGELEMVTLACAALRSVSISHCDSLLDATCGTFADGGGLGHQAAWRCPNLRHAHLAARWSTQLCCRTVTSLFQKQLHYKQVSEAGPGASTRFWVARLCPSQIECLGSTTYHRAGLAIHCHTMRTLIAWCSAYR